MVLGSAIVALPDSEDRVVALSDAHGPARTDVIGLAVFSAGYVVLARLVWRRRSELPRRLVVGAAAIFAAGAGLLGPAVAYDLGALWVLAASVMAAPQAYLLLRGLARTTAFSDPRPEPAIRIKR